MAIGVDGQYLFQFKIGPYEDFIEESELISFVMIEQAGNLLPTFELSFRTSTEQVLTYLNESNELSVSYGRDRMNLEQSTLVVSSSESVESGYDKRLVTCKGFITRIEWLFNSASVVYNNESSINVLRSLAQEFGFSFKTNIDSTRDSMNWVRPSVSPKRFATDVWLHMDLEDSFPIFAITAQNEIIIKDFVKDLTTPKPPYNTTYRWRLIGQVENPNQDIFYNGGSPTIVRSSLTNALSGYGMERPIQDMETGAQTSEFPITASRLALTDEIPTRRQVVRRQAPVSFINDNVHDNYQTAYTQNVSSLLALSTVQTTVSISRNYYPIRPLDQFIFKTKSIGEKAEQTADFNAGIYYCSKVARTLQSKSLETLVVLNRESLNSNRKA